MKNSRPHSEQTTVHPAFAFQRISLAVCILLMPLSLTCYLLSWEGNQRAPLTPLITSGMAGATGNTIHFIGAISASFLLPLGYLGMSLLGMRRAPWLATICAALSLVGWIPWSALMGLDSLAYDINQKGLTPQFSALWTTFNGDPVMTIYLLIYVVGHLLSAVLIGFMLGRLRLVPVWAAWAFALTSPLTIPVILIHSLPFQDALKYLLCILWFLGTIPAALALLTNKDVAQPSPAPSSVGEDSIVLGEKREKTHDR